MKAINFFFVIIIFFTCCISCEKELDVPIPKLDVSLDKAEIKVGESVIFDVNGYEASQILFYSGEELSEFQYSNVKRYMVDPGMKISFSSRKQFGQQQKQLSILLSTEFVGEYDSAAITNSYNQNQWIDISDKMGIPIINSEFFIPSRLVDISDYMTFGKPFYIAFRYTQKPQETNLLTNLWSIQNFNCYSVDSIGGNSLNLFNQSNMAFSMIDITKNIRPSRSNVTPALNYLYGPERYVEDNSNFNPDNLAYNDPYSEVWAISKNLNTDSIEIGYDKPETVVKITDVTFIKQYAYQYNKPGVYKAVFVAVNSSIDVKKEITKEFLITVRP